MRYRRAPQGEVSGTAVGVVETESVLIIGGAEHLMQPGPIVWTPVVSPMPPFVHRTIGIEVRMRKPKRSKRAGR